MSAAKAASLCQRMPLPIHVLIGLGEDDNDLSWVVVQKQSIIPLLRTHSGGEITVSIDFENGFFLQL